MLEQLRTFPEPQFRTLLGMKISLASENTAETAMRVRTLVSAIGSKSATLIPTLLTAGLCAAIAGCGGGDSDSTADSGAIPLTVPKATCATGDVPESALQGQVPASMRASENSVGRSAPLKKFCAKTASRLTSACS